MYIVETQKDVSTNQNTYELILHAIMAKVKTHEHSIFFDASDVGFIEPHSDTRLAIEEFKKQNGHYPKIKAIDPLTEITKNHVYNFIVRCICKGLLPEKISNDDYAFHLKLPYPNITFDVLQSEILEALSEAFLRIYHSEPVSVSVDDLTCRFDESETAEKAELCFFLIKGVKNNASEF